MTSIRAFEASARHLSFTKAADELCVTQSAISRHIRQLEDMLGLRLFFRRPRGLVLTVEAEKYRQELADLFTRLSWATERVKRSAQGQELLHIHSYTTIAMYWLIPRMREFQEANPKIDLQLSASTKPSDRIEEQAHGVIRSGAGTQYASIRLFNVTHVPVCSPEYGAQWFPRRHLDELADVTLLHSISSPLNWQAWAQRVGLGDFNTIRGIKLESSAMAYMAAERGLGVAMAQREFVKDQLERGTLVMPFPQVVTADRAYYFASMPQYADMPSVRRFREWIAGRATTDQFESGDISR